MTRDEAVAQMQVQLAFRTDLVTSLQSSLILAQTILEKGPTLPFWLRSEDSYKRLTSGEERLGVPDDFLRECDDAVLRYVPDDSTGIADEVELVKEDYDQLRKDFKEEEPGIPQAYCLVGDYFRFFPLPDDNYLIRMIYYKSDTVLSSNVENGWLKHMPTLLMGKAGGFVAGGIRDKDAFAFFSRWEQEGMLLLTSNEAARDSENRDMQIGGPN